jgi:DNA-directed RNA polymerase specialized sigma subunit
VAAAALIDAARHYDPDYGTPFEIYAQIYMRDSIRGAIARNAAANANTQTVGRAAVARMRERAPEDFAGD